MFLFPQFSCAVYHFTFFWIGKFRLWILFLPFNMLYQIKTLQMILVAIFTVTVRFIRHLKFYLLSIHLIFSDKSGYMVLQF